jgi:hypothetical protein
MRSGEARDPRTSVRLRRNIQALPQPAISCRLTQPSSVASTSYRRVTRASRPLKRRSFWLQSKVRGKTPGTPAVRTRQELHAISEQDRAGASYAITRLSRRIVHTDSGSGRTRNVEGDPADNAWLGKSERTGLLAGGNLPYTVLTIGQETAIPPQFEPGDVPKIGSAGFRSGPFKIADDFQPPSSGQGPSHSRRPQPHTFPNN